MPFYEYECKACGAQTEVLQKITDKPLRKCAECGKNTLIKLVSAPIFRLKGGGWYETDFKTEQDKKRNLAGAEGKEDKAESKGESSADAKADSKADAKTDAKADTKADSKTAAKAETKAEAKGGKKSSAKSARSTKARKGK
ncbi:MAG: zinc ribbon domain-containing protein [Gammaproteobacteria bacterium]|nr:zinc ribbon domain-containing protein [Gammaproteobacteria bacterium]MBM4209784.1 zinc ribbon domain-containing protein [Gammaproteobacteria bacterium]MBM4223717.1 zinc ribbon domain-containing protein [Gammaproteobacteria bacterium]MBM4231072.1 zinc ribbon domain-containing protein [Gammaproteobacteria bacterium]